MKALKVSAENQKLLVTLLGILFADDFKRVELETTSGGVVVTFSNVGKNNLLNFLASSVVNSDIPLFELFMREIPEKLSIYATGNRSWAPVFVCKFALIGRSTGDNLVKFLNDTMKGLQRPIDRNDYKLVKEQADLFGDPTNEETVINIIKASSQLLGNDAELVEFFMTR